MRIVLFIQRVTRDNTTLGQENAWNDLSGSLTIYAIYSHGIWGGAGSSHIDRRFNPLYLTPGNHWRLVWLQRGHNKHLSWISQCFMLWHKRASVFLLYLCMGLTLGGRDGEAILLLTGFLLFPTSSQWHQGSLLGAELPKYLPAPLDAFWEIGAKTLWERLKFFGDWNIGGTSD